jgi:hypothetical protein
MEDGATVGETRWVHIAFFRSENGGGVSRQAPQPRTRIVSGHAPSSQKPAMNPHSINWQRTVGDRRVVCTARVVVIRRGADTSSRAANQRHEKVHVIFYWPKLLLWLPRFLPLHCPPHLLFIMGACVSSPSATSPDPREGSRAPTNTPEVKQTPSLPSALQPYSPSLSPTNPKKPSDVVTTLPKEWVTPQSEDIGSPAIDATPPRVDRRTTPCHALVSRVRQRAESLDREEQFTFNALETSRDEKEKKNEGSAGLALPSQVDRTYSCGVSLSDVDPLSPHPLSDTQGSVVFDADDELTDRTMDSPKDDETVFVNDAQKEKEDMTSKACPKTMTPDRVLTTQLLPGRQLILQTTPEGEHVLVVSPALNKSKDAGK